MSPTRQSKICNLKSKIPLLLCLLCLLWPFPASAQGGTPDDIISKVGFDQKLNAQVPLDLVFHDESGRAVHLSDYFGSKPVILTLAYYDCPNLCTLVLTTLLVNLQKLSFDIAKQFNIVTVSIDPRETSTLAAAKKATYLNQYNRPGATSGWHFLTGEQSAIQRLAATVGFRYAYDPAIKQYAHPAGVMLLTPQGRVARYFYGLEYTPNDLRLGLVEASHNNIGSPVDQVFLLCYHYDPVTGKYSLLITRVLQAAVMATVLILGSTLFVLTRRQRRKQAAPSRVEV